ncbi:MAG: NAD-dependent epimerase/dehydratase family protein [Alphaproteobacteria bacterium]|nr:NAD-dependent epimerase/dehydratase family protein [Alphaproteobacteria bacterium]
MPRVLVCGATGFIGRNIAEAYAKRPDHEVHAIWHERPPFDHPGLIWRQADLTQRDDVARVTSGMDVMIQAAAVTSGIRTTMTAPTLQIVDNAVMNSLLFAAAHENGMKHVVFFSCTVMLHSSDRPQTEEEFDPREPMHPAYRGAGWTKLYFENMCSYFSGLGRTRFTALRHSNIYGPYDKYDLLRSHVFGATITKVMSATDGRVMVWGSGEEKRDLLHADDLVDAVLRAVDRQEAPFGLYNIGLGDAISVRALVERIIRISGRSVAIEHDLTKPTVKTSVTLDCSRARRELGWQPRIGLDEGIRRTIAYWQAHPPARSG